MKNGVSEVYAEVIQKKLCQNLCVKYGPDEEQSVGGDSGQSSIFDHIVIRKNKEKYTINVILKGARLREKKILHEDYMAYSFGIVSKEKLAEKYFQEEIKQSKDKIKEYLVGIAIRLANRLQPERELSEDEKAVIRDYFSNIGS